MTWKNYFSTSIGKKLQMGFTGLFLILFLLVHCYINGQIFYNDGGVRFLEAAHFMGTKFVVRTWTVAFFSFLPPHIIRGLRLGTKTRSRRSVKYAVNPGSETSPWYRR